MVPTPTVIDQDKYNTLQAMDKQTFDEDESKSMHNVTTNLRVIQYNTICNREPHTMQVFNKIHNMICTCNLHIAMIDVTQWSRRLVLGKSSI